MQPGSGAASGFFLEKSGNDMQPAIVIPAMIAAALVFSNGLGASEMKSAPSATTPKAPAPGKNAVAKKPAPSKPPVDINSASKAQLKTLPGISDAEADRIIAGRPYRSKADLATRKILPLGPYQAISKQIIAKPAK